MASNSSRSATVLMPVTLTHQGQRLDLSLPSSVAVAELLPGLVEALGRLDAETGTRGLDMHTADGGRISQATS
ncbi:MAG: EsaB/YukD family protein, partial [Propionibacterium sp.]|nr:EsaB/YukD family protein [Propionibacterium sp.]